MATVQKDVLVSGQTAVTETFSIQNGSSRYFLIEAKDSSGSVVYKGDSTKDLDGTPVTLNIVMIAQNTGGGTTTTTTTDTTTTNTTTTTTTTTSDTTAPTITGVSPADSATGVSITSTITATFSESMDSTTITTSTFTLSGGVTGTVTYSGTTATFTPSSSLSYSTTYTATITTGVKDSAGNAMASNYSWSWTTGAAPASSNNANLSSLTVSGGVLNPSFTSGTTSYSSMFITQTSITVTPTAADSGATITVNGTSVTSGQASGSISLSDGANTITIVVTASDTVTTKTYTITANKLYQQAYTKASNTGISDLFGISVAISGDTLAVGASGESSNATGINGTQTDNSALESGAVYVFTRSGTTWTQQAYIKASNTESGDLFGGSVAISGDTLAVGAYFEDSNATGVNGNQTNNNTGDSGAVYVFQ